MCDGYIKSHGFDSNDSSCCSTTFRSFSMVSFRFRQKYRNDRTTNSKGKEKARNRKRNLLTFPMNSKECLSISERWRDHFLLAFYFPFFFEHFLVHFKPIKIGILFHILASVNIAFGVARTFCLSLSPPPSLVRCALAIANLNLASEKILRCIFLIQPHTIPNVSFQSNQNITKCQR